MISLHLKTIRLYFFAANIALYGGDKGIVIQDYANISSKNTIYSVSDDYSGETMTNPMIPDKYKNVKSEEVVIERHVVIGSGYVVLLGILLKEGSINAGIPFKKIRNRSKKVLKLENDFVREYR